MPGPAPPVARSVLFEAFIPRGGLQDDGMDFDEEGQRTALRVIAWSAGAAATLLWFAAATLLAVAAGRALWPNVIWTAISALLMGRLVTALVRHGLRSGWRPAELQVGLMEPQQFRDRLARHLKLWGYRYVDSGPRTGMGFLPPRRLRRVLPPVLVAWQGGGARVRGPRFLVRLAARLAVP